MAIGTYAELKTAVANWLRRSELTTRIPEFITMAEDKLYTDRRMMIRALESTTDLTIDAQSESLPTRFIGHRRLYLSVSPVAMLTFLTPENFWTKYLSSETSQPEAFTIEGDNILFGPAPDTTYTGKLLYYLRPAALSSDSDTNFVLANARGLLLYGALIQAATYIKDDAAIAKWAALYDDLLDQVFEQDKKNRYGGVIQSFSGVSVV